MAGWGSPHDERAGQLRTKFAASVTDGALKIVIATTPTTGVAGVTLAPDLHLIRAALLYADHVELISPAATMVGGLEVSPLLGSRSGLSTAEDSMADIAVKIAELVDV